MMAVTKLSILLIALSWLCSAQDVKIPNIPPEAVKDAAQQVLDQNPSHCDKAVSNNPLNPIPFAEKLT